MAQFKKGTSGNPKGRPRGIVNQAKLRKTIADDIPEIIAALTAQAKGGDVQACKLLIDRVLPALKPTDQPVSLPLAGSDLGADGRAVIEATGNGAVTPDQGRAILMGLGSLARIVETDELLRRVEALEKAANESSNQN